MDAKEKMRLISRRTKEIVQESDLKKVLEKKKPTAYIGYATTGRIHVGYFVPALKIGDFVRAGFKFKILLADMHAYLDDRKTPWDLLDARVIYYKEMMTALLKSVGVDTKKVEFVTGSDFQLDKKYAMNLYQMMGEVTFKRAKRAASEVVRFKEDADVGSYVYPLMQINDVIGLGADVAYAGIDQRGIYMLGRDLLPKVGKQKYACVFTPLIPGLKGGKMSASVAESKIDLLDSPKDVERKLNDAFCSAGVVEGNGVLAFLEHVVMPLKEDRGEQFVIERPEKYGSNQSFKNYKLIEKAYKEKKLHPADLKKALAKEINVLLAPIRKSFKGKERLLSKAYPK